MSVVAVAGGDLVVTFRYDPQTVELVKRLLHGRTFVKYDDRPGGEWRAPADHPLNAMAVQQLAERHGFTITDDAQAVLFGDGETSRFTLTVSEKGDRFYVHLPRNAQTREVIEPLFAVYDSRKFRWRVPLVPHAIDGLAKLVDAGALTADEDAQAVINAKLSNARTTLTDYVERRKASQEMAASIDVAGLGGELRPYQKAGVAFITETRRCLVGDQMGLGKTIEALAALELDAAYPAVIVCPAVVKPNWVREARKWVPGRQVAMLSGSKLPKTSQLVEPDIYVINYDVLHAWAGWLAERDLRAVIADESHYAKNPDARRTLALTELMAAVPEDGLQVLLSGTPITNHPRELISQLAAIDRLDDLGGKSYFNQRYMRPDGVAQNEIELHRRLRATCYLRREKDQVLTDLPAKQRATILLDVQLGAAYAQVKRETVGWLREHRNDPKTTDATRRAKLDVLTEEITKTKIGPSVDWIRNFLDSGQKLVVFAHHIAVQHKLVNAFPDCAHVLGKDKPIERQAQVDRFQTDPECRIIVCSLKAAGVGITLTAASDVVFVEMGWTPADMDQAEDRLHRFGQTDAVTAWYLLARDTEDEDIAELIDGKRAVVTAVSEGREVEDHESIVTELTRRLLGEGPAS